MGLATSRVCHVCGGEIDPQRTERGLSARVGVSARRAAWATLPPLTGRSRWAAASSLTVATSPRGAVLALPFVKWRVCVSLRGESPCTATHTHSLSAAVRAADKTPRPPAASRGRGPAPGRPGLAFFPPRCFVPLHLPGTQTGPEAASSLYTWGRRTGPDASAVTPEPRGPPGGRTRAGVWGRQGTAR